MCCVSVRGRCACVRCVCVLSVERVERVERALNNIDIALIKKTFFYMDIALN